MIPDYVFRWMKAASHHKMRALAASAFEEPESQVRATEHFFDAAVLHRDIIDGDWYIDLGIEACAFHALESCELFLRAHDPPDANTLAVGLARMPINLPGKREILAWSQREFRGYTDNLRQIQIAVRRAGSLEDIPPTLIEPLVRRYPGVSGLWWALYRTTRNPDYLDRAGRFDPKNPRICAMRIESRIGERVDLADMKALEELAGPFLDHGFPEVDLMLSLAALRLWQTTDALSAWERARQLADAAARGHTDVENVTRNATFVLEYLDILRSGSDENAFTKRVRKTLGFQSEDHRKVEDLLGISGLAMGAEFERSRPPPTGLAVA